MTQPETWQSTEEVCQKEEACEHGTMVATLRADIA
nr:MAG TPA: hypothetical protein [Caudoviricetes sp.]